MTVDNRLFVPGQNIEDPFKHQHDMSTTQETIKQLLANGTPDWARFPQDYKQMAKESYLAEKEISDTMARQYRLADQETFENREARMVNPIGTKEFVDKLRSHGVRCFVVQNTPQQAGLWVVPPGQTDKVRYVAFLQVPALYEWSVVNVNKHGVADGEAYRGWRTILMEGAKKQVWTEQQIHSWFGKPLPNDVSYVYYRSLWELRNNTNFEDQQFFTEK